MPNLVKPGLSSRDIRTRRVLFRRVRIGQIFSSWNRWYQKVSFGMAVKADTSDQGKIRFAQGKSVNVIAEGSVLSRQGLTFEEFMRQQSPEI
jgi:hypothetical protein